MHCFDRLSKYFYVYIKLFVYDDLISTQQPSALERTSVSRCFSLPTGSECVPFGRDMTGKFCKSLTTVYETSIIAKSSPRHCLGPPLKGKYAHPIPASSPVSHRSGRNLSASGPYMFLLRELTYWEKTTISPFLTSIG